LRKTPDTLPEPKGLSFATVGGTLIVGDSLAHVLVLGAYSQGAHFVECLYRLPPTDNAKL
jgi:hypothetical protein